MTVATFSAGLTGGIVFAIPTDGTGTSHNGNTVRTILSIAFLFFTLSLFSAFYVRIEVLTERKRNWSILQSFYRGGNASRVAIISSAYAVTVGFLLDGVALILIGQTPVGAVTIGVVGTFGIFVGLIVVD